MEKLTELGCEHPEFKKGIAHIPPYQTFTHADASKRTTVYVKDDCGGAVDLETGCYYNPPVFSHDHFVRIKIKQLGFTRC